MKDYDFGGWATRNDLKCADGRTIRKDAFKESDGQVVPLVWNHQYNDPTNVLGFAVLKNRDSGVYAYGTFNDTEAGQHAKALVAHGDVSALSIYANQLRQNGNDVLHGKIREVSLVLAGANPGAFIDTIIKHGEDCPEEAIIFNEEPIELHHSEESSEEIDKGEEQMPSEEIKHAAEEEEDMGEETIADVYNTLSEKQKKAVKAMVGMIIEQRNGEDEEDEEDEEEEEDMKHNVFESDYENEENVLTHSDMMEIIDDAQRFGSVRESFLQHGIEDIDLLFPEAKNLNNPPEWIKREMDWVAEVMNKTHHTPFSRIKSMFADLTEDAARAKGYIKGNLKKTQVFSLLKRTTDPQTVYKTQKMDRDDVIDITDFDVIAWIKSEMRVMLNEELARAILIGDGRLASDDDKISEDHIRPILNDADLFTIRWSVAGTSAAETAKNFIVAAIKSRKNYQGSGNPTLFTTEDMLTEMLLLEDGIGHRLYKTEAELATALRVSKIVTVPVMENCVDADEKKPLGIIVNLTDYNVGADKGGAVSLFDDFDIDYNKMKYLIETRCSGALVKPFSAIVLREGTKTESEEPTMKAAMDEFRRTKHIVPDPAPEQTEE